jgi:uncharacterized protein
MLSITEWSAKDPKIQALVSRCARALKEVNQNARVVLYGSYARGDSNDDSDVDLVVLIDEPATLEKENRFRRKLYAIELETGFVLTLHLFNLSEWNTPLYHAMPFVNNVEREGVLL